MYMYISTMIITTFSQNSASYFQHLRNQEPVRVFRPLNRPSPLRWDVPPVLTPSNPCAESLAINPDPLPPPLPPVYTRVRRGHTETTPKRTHR